MLDLAVLGLLNDAEMHGYELRRRLAEFGFWSVSFGSLYPALRRLERKGFIAAAAQSGRRKVYRLTATGQAHFRDLLDDDTVDVEDEKGFNLKLAFFRHLDSDSRIGILERRRALLVDRLAGARASLKRVGKRTKQRMDRYTLSLIEHGVRSAEADIAWLDELLETERAQAGTTRRRRRAPGGASAPAVD